MSRTGLHTFAEKHGTSHVLGADGESYEDSAYRDGRIYYGKNPNAPGVTSGDVFLVDVPGWHWFDSYYEWFRRGYDDAKNGRSNAVGVDRVPTTGSGLQVFANKYSTSPRAAERVGDWGDFASGALSGVFSAVNAGINEQMKEDQQNKVDAESEALLDACIAADGDATRANAQASVAALRNDPSAAADAAAAAAASARQDAAGAKLPPDRVPLRVAAAKRKFDSAAATWRSMSAGQPGYDFAKCMMDAAQVTLDKASGYRFAKQVPVASTQQGAQQGSVKPKTGSFWTDPLVGPIPGWGVVGGGVGLSAILWRLVRGKWGI